MPTRKCPACGKDVYHTRISNCRAADRKKKICLQCENKRRKIVYVGKNNPFYNRHHTTETKNKLRQTSSGRIPSKETRTKMGAARTGIRNGMFGRCNYDVWLEKYGQEKADELLEAVKNKISVATSGRRNPMYGKPSPNGAGNGWSGWYNHWFFRSLRELSYVINELEKHNRLWRTAENLRIPYKDWKNDERTYSPDFLVEDKFLIEIKPKKLHSSKAVQNKARAAIEFCQKNKYEYQLIDYPVLADDLIISLRQEGKITFTDRYELLFREKYLCHN